MKIFYILSGLVGLVCFINLSRCIIAKEPIAANQKAKEFWQSLKTVKADSSFNHKKKPLQYWADIIGKCQTLFDKIQNSQHRDHILKYFVDQFGQDGAQADFRWLTADHHTTLSTFKNRPKYSKEYLSLQNKMCELLVHKLLDDEKYRSRYYRATLWSEQFLGTNRAQFVFQQDITFSLVLQHTQSGFANKPAEEYWWYARDFILIAHATGRDDLLKEITPEELKKRFEKFDKWFKENRTYLRVDPKYPRWVIDKMAQKNRSPLQSKRWLPKVPIPDKPFEDWKGPPSPTPQLLKSL